MAKVTKTTETTSATIKLTLTRDVTDDVAYMDGYNMPNGRKVYESYDIVVTPKAGGKAITAWGKPGDYGFLSKPTSRNTPTGAVARLGDAYIGQVTYDAIMALIADLDAALPKSAEQIVLESAATERKARGEENLRRMEAEEAKRAAHPGWCNKCGSYCYGDCEANR